MANKRYPKILAIVGPTAVGKTELSIRLASKIDGEIVSVDSRQIYKHMDIGTSKPTHSSMILLSPPTLSRTISGNLI